MKKIYVYKNERNMLLKCDNINKPKNMLLANLEDVIDFYIKNKRPIENTDEFICIQEGNFKLAYVYEGDLNGLSYIPYLNK